MLRAAQVAAGREARAARRAAAAGHGPGRPRRSRRAPEEIARAARAVDAVRALPRAARSSTTGDRRARRARTRCSTSCAPTFAALPTIARRALRDELVADVATGSTCAPSSRSSSSRSRRGARRSRADAARRAAPPPAPPRPRRSRDRVGDPGRSGRVVRRRRAAAARGPTWRRSSRATEEVERRFLAFCLALPDLGAEALAKIDPAEHFTSAARPPRGRSTCATTSPTPREGVAADDDPELARSSPSSTVRAGREPASPATLDAQRLQLELRRLDRRLAAIRAGRRGRRDRARGPPRAGPGASSTARSSER